MLYLIFMMLMISLTLLNTSHPVTILCLILAQTLLICSLMWLTSSTSWFSFILFLIFLGGLMILFVYVVSLASNEKFEMKTANLVSMTTVSLGLLFIMTIMNFFEHLTPSLISTMMLKISVIFSNSMVITATLMMCYLFLTLLVAVKISSKFEGPLRNLN